MEYLGGAAVRTQLTDRVFTANESPASEKIPFHHEMAQTPAPPTHLFFYCEQAASTGGETPILPSTEIYKDMFLKHPAFMEKLETLGLKYIRVMPEEDDPTSAIGRGWKSTFLTDSKGSLLLTVCASIIKRIRSSCALLILTVCMCVLRWSGSCFEVVGFGLGMASRRQLEDHHRNPSWHTIGSRGETIAIENLLQYHGGCVFWLE